MDTLTLWQLAALAAASTLVGFSKTAVSGANTISLAVFAAVLPARESTGVLLPDPDRRRCARRPRLPAARPLADLWRLFPAVAVGVVVGTLFMVWADDAAVRTSIGAILLFMAGVTVWRRRRRRRGRGTPERDPTPARAGSRPVRTVCSAASPPWSPTRAAR